MNNMTVHFSYLLMWSLNASSCCLSGAVIISSTSVSCSGSAPLACRDARMASIRWDFSSRRLSGKQEFLCVRVEFFFFKHSPVMCETGWESDTHLLSLVSNRRLSMRFATVCTKKKTNYVYKWAKKLRRQNNSHWRVLFYLVAALQQHPGSGELVDGVQVKCTWGGEVGSFWNFLYGRTEHKRIKENIIK